MPVSLLASMLLKLKQKTRKKGVEEEQEKEKKVTRLQKNCKFQQYPRHELLQVQNVITLMLF